jgi:hypothetical protein
MAVAGFARIRTIPKVLRLQLQRFEIGSKNPGADSPVLKQLEFTLSAKFEPALIAWFALLRDQYLKPG